MEVKKYKIEFIYDTGDSFSESPGQKGEFDYEFDSLDSAKETLRRMKEHYLWRLSEECTYEESRPAPVWYKPKPKTSGFHFYYFNIIGNDEEEIWLSAMEYLGYFESLVSAEIICTSNDMRFDLR